MTDALSAAHRLRRISAAIREGQPIPAEDAEPLAEGIDAYFGGQFPSLDHALGIASTGRGKADARRLLALEERNSLFRDLAEIVGGEIGDADSEAVWNCADALAGLIEIDHGEDKAEAEHLVAAILRACGGKPLSRSQIARILQP